MLKAISFLLLLIATVKGMSQDFQLVPLGADSMIVESMILLPDNEVWIFSRDENPEHLLFDKRKNSDQLVIVKREIRNSNAKLPVVVYFTRYKLLIKDRVLLQE